jgi:hypothetical protein
MKTFSSAEVCKMVGITYRQLTYWRMQGYVRPSTVSDAVGRAPGSGVPLRWTPDDVKKVRRLKNAFDELRNLGVRFGRPPVKV